MNCVHAYSERSRWRLFFRLRAYVIFQDTAGSVEASDRGCGLVPRGAACPISDPGVSGSEVHLYSLPSVHAVPATPSMSITQLNLALLIGDEIILNLLKVSRYKLYSWSTKLLKLLESTIYHISFPFSFLPSYSLPFFNYFSLLSFILRCILPFSLSLSAFLFAYFAPTCLLIWFPICLRAFFPPYFLFAEKECPLLT
jgi:hypothetical protein